MANMYKDQEGHWTTKENDGGPCYHKVGRRNNKYQAVGTKGEREDIDKDTYKMFKDNGVEDEDFDTDENEGLAFNKTEKADEKTFREKFKDADIEEYEEDGQKLLLAYDKNNNHIGTFNPSTGEIFFDEKEEAEPNPMDEFSGPDQESESFAQKESKENLMNPENPKYKGFSPSNITNAKEVDKGVTFKDFDSGKERKLSIIEYIPYGALKDGDNRKLYGIVDDYDGSDSPKIGAIVAPSLESAKEQLKSQVQLGIQGSDRYLKRGKYDEDYFNLIRDNKEEGDDEKYKERYGWDFNKPFAEHDFMKDDPYNKYLEEQKNAELSDKDYAEALKNTFKSEERDQFTEEQLLEASKDLKEASDKNPVLKQMILQLLGRK